MAVLGFLLASCGDGPGDNSGFPKPPLEDIEDLAFVVFPEATLVDDQSGLEDSYLTIDSGRVCFVTSTRRQFELAEPVLFSELQTWHNDLAVEAGWDVTNTRDPTTINLFHPRYRVEKRINERNHWFFIRALQPDGTGTVQISEDQLVNGYVVEYAIRHHADNPVCGPNRQ